MSAFPPFAFASWKNTVSRREFSSAAARSRRHVTRRTPSWADASSAPIPGGLAALNLSRKTNRPQRIRRQGSARSLSGQLLLAKRPVMTRARRVWNGAFDRYPALHRALARNTSRCGEGSGLLARMGCSAP